MTASATEHEPTAPRVKLTPEAVEFAKHKRVECGMPEAALRVGVKGGGCAGLTYVIDFTSDPPRDRDIVYDFDGLPVYTDERSLKYIEGAVIEYQKTLMYQGFKWNNPLEDSSCGCGLTFSVKKELKTV
jgi:iron-sulfur cluster assembly protein